MVGDDPERDETETTPASAERTGDGAVAEGAISAAPEAPIGDPEPSEPIGDPEPSEPPAGDPEPSEPVGDPAPNEPPVGDPAPSEPPVGDPEPPDAPTIEEPPPVEEPGDERPVGETAGAFVDDLDLPPPTSVPVPAPYAPPKVVPPAQIEEVTPAEGSVLGDTRITLIGRNLYRESIVRIDGQIAKTVGATEPREIRVVTPPRKAAGLVDLSVQNPNSDVVTIEKAFRYQPLPPPKISSVAPDHVSAKRGGEITIVGEGFVKGTTVLLDGIEAEKVTHVDATTLDVRAKAGTHGKAVDVVVRNPDGKQDVARRAFMYDERYD